MRHRRPASVRAVAASARDMNVTQEIIAPDEWMIPLFGTAWREPDADGKRDVLDRSCPRG
jgi:hypothetical protein